MRKFILATAAASAALAAAAPAMAQRVAGPFAGPRVEVLGGYDLQSANGLVFGAEGEITGATTRARSFNEFVPGDRFEVRAGRDLYVGARLGYAISPLALVYAKGGYTNARVQSRYDAGTTSFRDGVNLDGFRLGAGLEYNMSPTTYVKGEYRYSNYNNLDGFDIDLDRHQLIAGVGFRF